jgi:prolyl oligopeptidase
MIFDTHVSDDVVVADIEPSPDGRVLRWCESVGGSDWRTWRFLDIDSGERLPDVVDGTKLWARWMPSSDGLLYIAFPSAEAGATRKTAVPQLKLHRLGTPTSDDELIYENPSSPSYFFPSVTTDRIVLTFLYEPGSSIAWAPIDGPWEFERVIRSDDQLWLVGHGSDGSGDTFYVATTNDAPYGNVLAVDAISGATRVVVPSSDVPLPMVNRSALAGSHVFVAREQLGRSVITMHSLDGSSSYDVDLPDVGRFVPHDIVEPVTSSPDGRSMWFAVTTPASPGSLLRHDIDTRTTVVEFSAGAVSLDVVADVVWTTSEDGTKVPMTLIRSGSSAASGDPAPPVVIFGYGGGGDSMEPYDFTPWRVAWMEAGGVVALAHIRGGGELGAEWQAAAARGGKLLAMQDFIGCAQWLVDTGYTSASRVAITGRSSGAMLAAAATVARPELFGACVAEVGMFDPLRYHHFGLGSLMIAEYGTSDDLDDFAAMIAYSPLHNVPSDVALPPFLLTVHTDDDRVAPGGPYKFAQTLQDAQKGDAPIILRLRSGAGHHGGASMQDEYDERADILAFLGHSLGLDGCA